MEAQPDGTQSSVREANQQALAVVAVVGIAGCLLIVALGLLIVSVTLPTSSSTATPSVHYPPTSSPAPLRLRVNYGHDWVESFYEEGHKVDLWVTEIDRVTVKATATVFTEPKDFWGGEPGFQTVPADWVPAPPDLEPYDWVFAVVDNGPTAVVQLGEIRGEVTIFGQMYDVNDNITGTIEAPWIGDPVVVECLDWGSGLDKPINKDAGEIAADGVATYLCEWDRESEWDLAPWQEIGVGYSTPEGHWVANAFHAEHWMGTWIYELSGGLQEGDYSSHFDWFFTTPDPGDTSQNYPRGPVPLEVSTAAPAYEGYVLVGPWPEMSPRAWTGSGCEVVSEIHPGQPIRFIWGWVNDDSMNDREALEHFNSFTVRVFWDGETSGSGTLERVDGLRKHEDREARFEYMCGFARDDGDANEAGGQPPHNGVGVYAATVSDASAMSSHSFSYRYPCPVPEGLMPSPSLPVKKSGAWTR